MKLTDEQNKSFISLLEEAAALDDDKIQDCAVQLLTVAVAYKGEAQAAWQEVDRLKEEKNILEARVHHWECESRLIEQDNEQLKSQLDDAAEYIKKTVRSCQTTEAIDYDEIIKWGTLTHQAIQRIKGEAPKQGCPYCGATTIHYCTKPRIKEEGTE